MTATAKKVETPETPSKDKATTPKAKRKVDAGADDDDEEEEAWVLRVVYHRTLCEPILCNTKSSGHSCVNISNGIMFISWQDDHSDDEERVDEELEELDALANQSGKKKKKQPKGKKQRTTE